MVERVKGLQPELKRGVFTPGPGEVDILVQSQVPVVPARTVEVVAPPVSEHSRLAIGIVLIQRGLLQNRGVKPRLHRAEGGVVEGTLIDLKRTHCVAHHTRTDAGGITRCSAPDVDRLTGKESGNTAELPSSQPLPQKAAGGVLEERQSVNIV